MKVQSLAKKLASMPPQELTGRAWYELVRRVERVQHRASRLAPPNRLHRALDRAAAAAPDWQEALLARRRALPSRWFAGLDNPDRTRALLHSDYADEIAQAITWGDRALRHEIHFFGEVFTFGGRYPWHEDPVSRRPWPNVLHQEIPAGRDAGFADIKYVWELSRHQFVLDLGKAYFLTGRDDYAVELRAVVLDWIDQNPYGIGVNWASPLEPAYRGLAWLWAYWFVLDDAAWTPAEHARWVEGFYDIGRFLYRHLELFSSPYNHLLGEASVLYILGQAFPEFRDAARWRDRGRHVLVSRLPAQFYDDGGTVEQATCYHHASLGFYLLAALLGRYNGDEWPREVWRAIERGVEFSVGLTQPDGQQPAIGDTDDARPVYVERRAAWDYREFAAVGAALFGRADFTATAGRFPEAAVWLLGLDGRRRFEKLQTVAAPGNQLFQSSGYAVLRANDSGDYVCFDAGEQAGGLRPDDIANAAHGHADALSVVVWLGGRPVLVDAGFYTYNSDREWERYFRETAAHNTIRVNRRDQSTHLEKMAWSHVPRVRLDSWHPAPEDGGIAAGSHDGYVRTAGVTHRRTVWLRPGGYVLIHDALTGTGEHDIEINFQFAPMALQAEGDRRVTGPDADLHIITDGARVNVQTAEGGAAPADGWIAPGLGVRLAAPRATVSARTSMPASFLTVVADPRRVTVETRDEARAFVVRGRDFTDVATLPGAGGTVSVVDSDGVVAVCRVVDGQVVEALQAGGSRVRAHASALARLISPAPELVQS